MGWMIGFEYTAKKRNVVVLVPKMAKAHYFIFILSSLCSGPTSKIAPEPKRLFRFIVLVYEVTRHPFCKNTKGKMKENICECVV